MKKTSFFLYFFLATLFLLPFLSPVLAEAQTGSLRVIIGPQEALDAGAQWRRVGQTDWRDSGSTESNLPDGIVEIEFKPVEGWEAPATQFVTISAGFVRSITRNYTQSTSLIITLEPQGARTDGAQWGLRDDPQFVGTVFRNSGDIRIIPAGEYIVTFRDVNGWLKPVDQIITIEAGETNEYTFSYTPEPGTMTGRLSVSINPPAARDAGARWRLAKPISPTESAVWPWRRSGDTEIDIPEGEYLIEFEEVDGWLRPENQVVQIIANETLSAAGTYRQPPEEGGSVQVVIEPLAAREAGAQWRVVGTTEWLDSGETVRGLIPGTHTIEYSGISGWTRPPSEGVSIKAQETYFAIGTYTQAPSQLGRLIVNILPEAAALSGAQWALRTEGFTDLRNSGDILIDIPVGDHILTFSDIEGWTKPADKVVTISAGQALTTTANYSEIPSFAGQLQVIIYPVFVNDVGARWRLVMDPERLWRTTGDIEINIPFGTYLIEFEEVVGWAKPITQPITIGSTDLIVVSADYEQGGTLHVYIEPQVVREQGAGWRIAGRIPDTDSGWYTDDLTTLDGLRPGEHTIEYNAIPGWIKPHSQTVMIEPGSTTFARGMYVPDTEAAQLRVLIEPLTAYYLGGRWRRVGTQTWRHSGEIERGLPEGTYTLEFQPVIGYDTPGNKAVYLFRGQNNSNIIAFYSGNDNRGLTPHQWLLSFYAAYWGRAADPQGLGYWLGQIADGLSIVDVAENFALSPEAASRYPYFQTVQSGLSPTDMEISDFVHNVYQNLFQRPPDIVGKEYWTHVLNSGASTPGAFIGNVLNAALQLGSTDWMTVSNKIHVAEHFVWRFGTLGRNFQDSDLILARGALRGVSSDPSTVISARDSIDHHLWP